MTTIHHSTTPQDRAVVARLRAMLGSGPKPEMSAEGRAAFDAMLGETPPAEGVECQPSSVGGVSGCWCRPSAPQHGAAILYLHGGAYMMGSSAGYANFVGQIASRCGVAAFVPDYRLAPEHRFPAAVQDALAAWTGLVAMGYRRIALVGDSAGGGLALSLLAQLCAFAGQAGGIAPACAAAVSPWTDLGLSGASMDSRAIVDPLLSREALRRAADAYLGDNGGDDPRASPLFAQLAHLAPVRLHVGADEVLLDDSVRYADALRNAGGVAQVHVWEGMVHVFASDVAHLAAAREALDDIAVFLEQMLVAPGDAV